MNFLGNSILPNSFHIYNIQYQQKRLKLLSDIIKVKLKLLTHFTFHTFQ